MYSRLQWLVYELTYWILLFSLTLGWSLRTRGRRYFPKSGAVLVLSNHQSFLDPPTIGACCPRHLAYLARKPLFNNKILGTYMKLVNAVAIDQEGVAKEGIQNILTRLRENWPVLVFPEGARTADGEMLPLQAGVSLLIKRVDAPVVPVGIAGAFASWPRWKKLPLPSPLFLAPSDRTMAVVFGKPRPAAELASLPRETMMRVLTADLAKVQAEAEALRRKR